MQCAPRYPLLPDTEALRCGIGDRPRAGTLCWEGGRQVTLQTRFPWGSSWDPCTTAGVGQLPLALELDLGFPAPRLSARGKP